MSSFVILVWFSITMSVLISGRADHNTPRIVNGTMVQYGEFKFMAAIFIKNRKLICGGMIITEDTILTGAQCIVPSVIGDIHNVDITLGVLNLEQHVEKYDFKVKKIISNPDYVAKDLLNDIGMIKLDRPIKFLDEHSNCSRTCLPLSPSEIQLNMSACMSLGWGSISTSTLVSNDLMKVDMPMANNSACLAKYPAFNETIHICAGYPDGGAGPCFYDNGGPLVCPLIIPGRTDLVYTTVGLITRTDDCAKPNSPTLYTRIAPYKDFLLKNNEK